LKQIKEMKLIFMIILMTLMKLQTIGIPCFLRKNEFKLCENNGQVFRYATSGQPSLNICHVEVKPNEIFSAVRERTVDFCDKVCHECTIL